jgi:hypothetical protein
MRPLSLFVATAIATVAWAASAAAEAPEAHTLEPSSFSASTVLELDDAFEKSTGRQTEDFLSRLAGPTSMDCKHAVLPADLETCIVTAEGEPRSDAPATLAQH